MAAHAKDGIGKLRERPQGVGYRPGERRPALERPTRRPGIRATVIAAARINIHRKMLKLASAGLFPTPRSSPTVQSAGSVRRTGSRGVTDIDSIEIDF